QREDVSVDHEVLRAEEPDAELLGEVVEQRGLVGGEPAVETHRAANEPGRRNRSADHVEEAWLAGCQVRRPEAERDPIHRRGEEEGVLPKGYRDAVALDVRLRRLEDGTGAVRAREGGENQPR